MVGWCSVLAGEAAIWVCCTEYLNCGKVQFNFLPFWEFSNLLMADLLMMQGDHLIMTSWRELCRSLRILHHYEATSLFSSEVSIQIGGVKCYLFSWSKVYSANHMVEMN